MAKRIACLLLAVILALQAAAVFAGTAAYTVREGDTLFSISRKTGVPVDVLCAFNGIQDPGKLKVGMEIRIPQEYTVVKGDTLYGIAKSFSVPLKDLQSLNALDDGSQIRVGDRLFLPAGASAVAQSTIPAKSVDNSEKTAEKPVSIIPPHPGRFDYVQGKFTGLVFYGNRGDTVVSAASGLVEWVAPFWGWGKVIIIQGDDGYKFIYAGNEELLVNVGDRVKAGSKIANLGVSPQGGGAKLYFGMQAKSGQSVNPGEIFSKI